MDCKKIKFVIINQYIVNYLQGLYRTLSGCNEGKGILLQYQEKGLLNNSVRRRLCQIIINEELKDDPEKKITSARFYQIAYEI